MRTIFALLLFLVHAPGFAQPVVTIAPQLEARTIADGVHVITHTIAVAPANSLVVEMGAQDILLVDTPWLPSATVQLLDWIEKTLGKRKITAVNTHFHNDRTAGNEVLRARNIPVHGSDRTAELLRINPEKNRAGFMKLVDQEAQKEEIRRLKFVEPDQVFPLKEGRTLTFGSRKAEIFYPGPGHTVDNVVVYIPDREVLFGGCFIVGLPKLGNLSDADVKAWPASLKTLQRFKISHVIAGHGLDFSKGLIDHTAGLLARK
jgi:metallo-beta-lactamase class B